jgi:predicted PolB exonuclease-like 3'-5' exonuclease
MRRAFDAASRRKLWEKYITKFRTYHTNLYELRTNEVNTANRRTSNCSDIAQAVREKSYILFNLYIDDFIRE